MLNGAAWSGGDQFGEGLRQRTRSRGRDFVVEILDELEQRWLLADRTAMHGELNQRAIP
jgi:hypothetical protein